MNGTTAGSEQVLVLGIGNLLLSDEGVGVHVAQELMAGGTPAGVQVRDAGTPGFELVEELSDGRRVIVVDALQAGLSPGAVRVFAPAEVRESEQVKLSSLHGVGLLDVCRLAQRLGRRLNVTVIGVQVASVGPGTELSPALRAHWAEIMQRVRQEVNQAASDRAEATNQVAPRDGPSGGL